MQEMCQADGVDGLSNASDLTGSTTAAVLTEDGQMTLYGRTRRAGSYVGTSTLHEAQRIQRRGPCAE